ncbi:uncharacterized protein ARMOST_15934 [Armillaria ostoyae]|uniref:Uncharacterized protein n=1 Tax=Armillaria ostoyae TaxID=47428 RepID=A0A284RUU2_ARMOS|nr:uncharacterized protein ARMOST_15934 [Armillaria ostoyae]
MEVFGIAAVKPRQRLGPYRSGPTGLLDSYSHSDLPFSAAMYIWPYPIRIGGYTLTAEQFAEFYKRIQPKHVIVLDEDLSTGTTLGLAAVNFSSRMTKDSIPRDARSTPGVSEDGRQPHCFETTLEPSTIVVGLLRWLPPPSPPPHSISSTS